ncbi:MAG: L-dopachrome tautomerase-related protein [Pseudomonadota bacterium]
MSAPARQHDAGRTGDFRRIALLAGALFAAFMTAAAAAPPTRSAPAVGTLEDVALLDIRPGNVTATHDGRVFATVHPLDRPSGLQLIEITGRHDYRPWPDASLQSSDADRSDTRLDSPLGITRDSARRLWIVDMGMHLGTTRLWAFDIATGAVAHKIALSQQVAPKGAFVQDLAVDADRGWVYLADIAPPAIIVHDLKTGQSRRFSASPALQPEARARMKVEGRITLFGGTPARVGINPLTLSADGETLYFGAMNGTHWHALPTRLLRDGAPDAVIAAAIRAVGRKPVSDGAATDDDGNHYFTNLNARGLDRLDSAGRLRPLVRDARLLWPDSVQFGGDAWLYVSVNQLHRASAFRGGADTGRPPYRIMRVWTGGSGSAREPETQVAARRRPAVSADARDRAPAPACPAGRVPHATVGPRRDCGGAAPI